MADLTDVITEAVEESTDQVDASVDDQVEVEDSTPTEVVEDAPEVKEATPEAPEAKTPDTTTKTDDKAPVDDFDKKFGVSPLSQTGKENRIPYSRVKKITEKATREAVEAKVKEFEPKLQEFETKVKDYETKFSRVAAFEDVMINNPEKFLGILSGIPAYRQFFNAVEEAFEKITPGQGTKPQTPVDQPVEDGMPQPNAKLADGSMVYDMDGLKSLMDWHAKQVEDKVTKQVEQRYKPIETEWQAHQRVQELVPKVQAQISEARTWDQFSENEAEIVKALQSNPRLSLEGAYRQVVLPKLKVDKEKLALDRTKMREELLKELKQAPKSTSATTATSKTTPTESQEPRDLLEVIAEQVKTLKGR